MHLEFSVAEESVSCGVLSRRDVCGCVENLDGTCEAGAFVSASPEKMGMSLPQVCVGPLQLGGAASLLSHLLSMFVSDHVSRLPGSPPNFVTSSSG